MPVYTQKSQLSKAVLDGTENTVLQAMIVDYVRGLKCSEHTAIHGSDVGFDQQLPIDPADINTVVAELAKEKIGQLYFNVKKFIEYQPSGLIRYDADLKMNIIAAVLNATKAGAVTPTACQQFEGWINAVQTEFFATKDLVAAGDLSTDVSYEMFEGKYGVNGVALVDPAVSTMALKTA